MKLRKISKDQKQNIKKFSKEIFKQYGLKYIYSLRENGCVISCLSMLLGQSFDDTVKDMEPYWWNEAADEGTDDDAWAQYLAAKGYAYQDICYEYTPLDKLIEPWPLKPFAPIHMCFVYAYGPHAVILLNDGRVLDPNDETIKSLSEYHRVYRMVGLWKVSEQLEFVNHLQPKPVVQ
jgi:hypothetical protein